MFSVFYNLCFQDLSSVICALYPVIMIQQVEKDSFPWIQKVILYTFGIIFCCN